MNIRSLGLKNILIDQNTQEEYFDLSAPSFEYNGDYGVKAIHYVTHDQAGRIDLISNRYFGSGQYIDAICILNNISNPFSIEEGDVLIIPNVSTNENSIYFRPKLAKTPDKIQSQYINTDRMSQKDKSRIDRLAAKGSGKEGAVRTPLPPNVLQPGQKSKKMKDGEILLGTNIPTRG